MNLFNSYAEHMEDQERSVVKTFVVANKYPELYKKYVPKG